MTRTASISVTVLPTALLLLTGCASATSDSGEDGASISIVASTNVYGDIARVVAGDLGSITSIISSPSQDPHEYEATAQDRLAIEHADVVIENGGGFDPFVDTLLDAAGSDPVVLDAVELSGLTADEGAGRVEGFNEHVWYDFHAVDQVAQELAQQLGSLRPDDAETFESNYRAFAHQLDGLVESAAGLRSRVTGQGVAITEPVPLYLLQAVGLVNKTPEEFSEAVEEGADVPARVLQETLDLFDGGQVVLLAYNEQAADETTRQVRSDAVAAGVPVVDFTETLPDGQTYVTWQQANLRALDRALD